MRDLFSDPFILKAVALFVVLPILLIVAFVLDRRRKRAQAALAELEGAFKVEKAKKQYEKAVAIAREGSQIALKIKHGSSQTWQRDYGDMLTKLGQMEEAEKLYITALKQAEKLKDRLHKRNVTVPGLLCPFLVPLGNLYLEQKKYKEAEGLFEEALKGCGDKNSEVMAHWPLFSLGQLNAARGDQSKAREFYERSRSLCKKALEGKGQFFYPFYERLAEISRALGKEEEAEHYRLKANELREKDAQGKVDASLTKLSSRDGSEYENLTCKCGSKNLAARLIIPCLTIVACQDCTKNLAERTSVAKNCASAALFFLSLVSWVIYYFGFFLALLILMTVSLSRHEVGPELSAIILTPVGLILLLSPIFLRKVVISKLK